MRVWLQKQKKKEEAKAVAQATTPPVEVTPAAPEVQPVSGGTEKPVDSIEETKTKAESSAIEQATGSADNAEDASQRAGSASVHPNEVGFQCLLLHSHIGMLGSYNQWKREEHKHEAVMSQKNAKEIVATCANDHEMLSIYLLPLLT